MEFINNESFDLYVESYKKLPLSDKKEIVVEDIYSLFSMFERLNTKPPQEYKVVFNREIVDLFSFKTSCSSLEKDGCRYDLANRPSGGATLIPGPNKTCYSQIDRLEEMKKWIPYQKVLEKLVKRYTRMSVDERIRQDVEKVIYNVITENYQDSSPLELKDIASMIPMLKECFPNEYLNAIKKALPKKNVLALKK